MRQRRDFIMARRPMSLNYLFVPLLIFINLCLLSSPVLCWFNYNDWNPPPLGASTPLSGLGNGDDGDIIQEPMSDDALHKLTSSLANSMSSSDTSHHDSSSSSCDHHHHDHDHNHDDHDHDHSHHNHDNSIGHRNDANDDDLKAQGYEKWDDHFGREKKMMKRKKANAKKANKRKDSKWFKSGKRKGVNRYDDDRDYDRHRDRDFYRDRDQDMDDQDFESTSESRRGLRRWFGRGRRSGRGYDKGRRYGSSYNSEEGGAIEDGDYDGGDDFGMSPSLIGRLRRRLFNRW